MISIEFFVNLSHQISGFFISGHSCSAPQGEDIICAAVSSAAFMTANTLTEILHINADITVLDQGQMTITVPKPDIELAQTILSGFNLHMQALEEQYKDYIHLRYTEV